MKPTTTLERLREVEADLEAAKCMVVDNLREIGSLERHLSAERKRLPEGTPPLHGPDCTLCVKSTGARVMGSEKGEIR